MSEGTLDLVRTLVRRWEQGNFATAEFFDPDVEFVRVGGDAVGTPGTWRGVDEMWKALVEWFQAWEDYRVEAGRFVDLGDRVLVVLRQTARGRRSGLKYDQETGNLFAIRGGKIVRWETYWDLADALEAAGIDSD